jgi:hypothetical protein
MISHPDNVILPFNDDLMQTLLLKYTSFLLVIMIAAMAISCSPQGYSKQRYSKPKRCNCPSFSLNDKMPEQEIRVLYSSFLPIKVGNIKTDNSDNRLFSFLQVTPPRPSP